MFDYSKTYNYYNINLILIQFYVLWIKKKEIYFNFVFFIKIIYY